MSSIIAAGFCRENKTKHLLENAFWQNANWHRRRFAPPALVLLSLLRAVWRDIFALLRADERKRRARNETWREKRGRGAMAIIAPRMALKQRNIFWLTLSRNSIWHNVSGERPGLGKYKKCRDYVAIINISRVG